MSGIGKVEISIDYDGKWEDIEKIFEKFFKDTWEYIDDIHVDDEYHAAIISYNEDEGVSEHQLRKLSEICRKDDRITSFNAGFYSWVCIEDW